MKANLQRRNRGRTGCRSFFFILGFLLFALASREAAGFRGGEEADRRQSAAVLTSGKAALEDGLHEVAQKQFEQYLRSARLTRDERAEVTILLARALYGQGKYAEALDALARAAQRGPLPRADETAFWKASCQVKLGRGEAALADLADFESKYPTSKYLPQTIRLRGWCCLKAGKNAEAFRAFEQYDRDFGRTEEAPANLLDWAENLASLGRDDEAVKVFEKLAQFPAEKDAVQEGRLRLGLLLVRKKKGEAARIPLDALANQENARLDRRAEAWFVLSQVYEEQKDAAGATNTLVRGIERAPTPELRQRGRTLLGQALLRTGHVDEGAGILKEIISANSRDPASALLQLELAQAYLDAGNNAKAVEEFQNYVEAFTNRSGQAQAQCGKGWALSNLGRFAEGALAFEKACLLFETPAEKEQCLFKTADAYFSNRQYKLALEAYERVLCEFPQSSLAPHAKFQACESLVRLQQKQEAGKRLRELTEKHPQSPFAERALLRVAELAEEDGRLPDAAAGYEKVMAAYTNGAYYDNALFSHGLLSYRLLRFNEALADFERVVKDFPESRFGEQAFYYRGWSRYMMGQDALAVAICTNFLARYPNSASVPDVLFWLGRCEYNSGKYERSEELFVRLAEKHPDHALAADARFWAGRSAQQRKEYRRAVEHFTRLAKEHPDSPRIAEARLYQGEALSEMVETVSSAILVFDEIINKHPTNGVVTRARLRKGDCQFTLGANDAKRYEEAIESYKAAAASAAAEPDQKLEAEFKIGRCLEKTGKTNEAFEQYYARVVCSYLHDLAEGSDGGGAAEPWFTRAAFRAADLMEAERNWRQAIRILERVIESGVPAGADAERRIKQIRSEHWVIY